MTALEAASRCDEGLQESTSLGWGHGLAFDESKWDPVARVHVHECL